MIRPILTSAMVAGVVAGLLAALLHFAFVQKLILLGEDYESGVAVHFAGVAPPSVPVAPDEAAPAPAAVDEAGAMAMNPGGEPMSNWARNAWTAVFAGLVYVAFALILVAGFGLARIYGYVVTARDGLVWGIAAYASFQLAPSLGLPPQLPGIPAADLAARQVWWLGTGAATAGALALLAYGRNAGAAVVAMILLAAPHVIGAPMPDGFSGTAPPELAGAFAARVLGVGFAVWALMGWVAGYVWERDGAVGPSPG